MNTMRTIVKRHPLVAFFVLTYLLSWLPWLFGGNNFAFGPLIATLIVAALSGGRAELGAWWQTVTRWRGGLGWYTLAILLPFAINAAAAALAVLLGAAVPSADKIAAWPDLFPTFPLYLIAFGPLGEEPGWRAFALPRLQPGRSSLARTLILGVLIVVWHLPLVISGQQPAILLLATFAAQIIYTWLANRVSGSVLIVMLAHAAQGAFGGEYFGTMFSGADATLETWLLAALYVVVALLVIALAGPSLARKAAAQPEAVGQPVAAG